jgi:hypothetical protein
MSDEHIVSLQSSMQYLSTRLPIIVFQRVEQLPPFKRSHGVCYVQTNELSLLILGIFMAQRMKCFLGILCYLSFSVVSDFEDDIFELFNKLHSFSSIA